MYILENEEQIGRLLKAACIPVAMPQDVKDQIRGRLAAEIEAGSLGQSKMWYRPMLVIPVLASLAGGLIAYGYHLSLAWV